MWAILDQNDDRIEEYVKSQSTKTLLQEDHQGNTLLRAAVKQQKSLSVLQCIILKDPKTILQNCLDEIISEENIELLKWIYEKQLPITEKVPPFITAFRKVTAEDETNPLGIHNNLSVLKQIKQFLLEATIKDTIFLEPLINYALKQKKDLFESDEQLKVAAINFAIETQDESLLQKFKEMGLIAQTPQTSPSLQAQSPNSLSSNSKSRLRSLSPNPFNSLSPAPNKTQQQPLVEVKSATSNSPSSNSLSRQASPLSTIANFFSPASPSSLVEASGPSSRPPLLKLPKSPRAPLSSSSIEPPSSPPTFSIPAIKPPPLYPNSLSIKSSTPTLPNSDPKASSCANTFLDLIRKKNELEKTYLEPKVKLMEEDGLKPSILNELW